MNARIAVSVVGALLALAGIVWWALIARREKSNAKAVLALAVFFLAWIISAAGGAFMARVEAVRTLWASMALGRLGVTELPPSCTNGEGSTPSRPASVNEAARPPPVEFPAP